jgi:hypothetical protein
MTPHLPTNPSPHLMTPPSPEPILEDLVALTEATQGAIEPLSDEDLDAVSGGRHHHHGHHGHHGGHHGHRHSHSDFHKHTVSLSGQTVTAKDGSSVTSFTINIEDISSHSDQVMG